MKLFLSSFFSFISAILCLPSNQGHSVSLIFVGDIALDGIIRYYSDHGTTAYNHTFTQIAPIIRNADVAIANLEGAIGTKEMRKNPVKEKARGPYLLAEPDSLESLKFAGFDAVTLANNHINDFGDATVNLTVRTLDSLGIGHFGINYGNQPYASQVPWIKDVNEIRLGFLGYEMIIYNENPQTNDEVTRKKFQAGMALFRKSTAKKDFAYLKSKKVDVIVAFMHWGMTTKQPIKTQKATAEFLRKIGVHVIVGCHTHTLQGHTFSRNYLMAYSLGNFVFGPVETNYWKFFSRQRWHKISKPNAKDVQEFESVAKHTRDPSRILKVEVNKDGPIAASYLPCSIEFNQETKDIQVVPPREENWVNVCAPNDKHCLRT